MNGTRSIVYVLLAVTALAAVTGRIAHVELLFEPSYYPTLGGTKWPAVQPASMPTLSSNDRSRWCAVRALVDEGTWVIGHRIEEDATKKPPYRDTGIVFQDGWKTVDMVLKPGTGEFYSSKPPLLTVLVAAEYLLLKKAFGWGITTHTNHVVRTVLITFNVVPFALYLWMLTRLLDRFGTSDWGRLFVFAAACHGTFINTFSITLNNHTLAACTGLAAVFPLLNRPTNESRLFGFLPIPEPPPTLAIAMSGFFAGLTTCFELPALAFAAALFGLIALRSPLKAAMIFVPAAAAPVLFEVWLNHQAVGQWLPVYAKVNTVWYQYDGSHWLVRPDQVKHGIDWARNYESHGAYFFHALVGHHGLFSLTPIWLLAFAGLIGGAIRLARRATEPVAIPRAFSPMVLLISLVLIGFYVLISTRNYGGMTSCLRWLIWLAPLWLLAMMPVADWLAKRRWGRWLGYLLLGVSAFSAAYPAWNPWRHPWLYDLLQKSGVIRY